MTLLGEAVLGKRASSAAAAHPSSFSGPWWGAAESATGLAITERNSLAHTAVYQAVQLIAGLMSVLPCHIIKRTGQDREEASGHPLWRLLHEEPNPESSWAQFTQAQVLNKLTFGNRYAEIEHTSGGRNGMRLWHIPSDLVTPRRAYAKPGGRLTFDPVRATPEDRRRGGTIVYEVRETVGGPTYIEPARMLHVPDLAFNGLVGFSRIRMSLETIAVGQARLRALAAVFGNDSSPGGVLERPADAPPLSPTGERSLIAAWEANHGGVHRKGRTAVLQEGTVFKPVSFTPEEARIIEAAQFSILEIAHIFNLRPHWLGHPGNSNIYANVENEFTQLGQVTLLPHVRADELEMRRKLLLPSERRGYFIEFDLKGLLRADSAARAAFYEKMIRLRVMTPNQVAREENLPPIPADQGGDTYGLQMPPRAPEPAAAAAASRAQLVAAFRPLLQDAAARAVAKETAAIRRAAERPGLADWLSDFYREQRAWVAKVVAPVVVGFRMAGGGPGGDAEAFAARWTAERLAELRAVSPDRLTEVLDRWERELPAQVAAQEIQA